MREREVKPPTTALVKQLAGTPDYGLGKERDRAQAAPVSCPVVILAEALGGMGLPAGREEARAASAERQVSCRMGD